MMSEITGLTKITDLPNVFPKPDFIPIGGELNAVLIHVADDGRLFLSMSMSDEKHKKRLLEVANEIMRYGIAPSP
jgi:hypothetical protein